MSLAHRRVVLREQQILRPPRHQPHPRPEAFPRDPASADAPASRGYPAGYRCRPRAGRRAPRGPIGVCPRPPPPRVTLASRHPPHPRVDRESRETPGVPRRWSATRRGSSPDENRASPCCAPPTRASPPFASGNPRRAAPPSVRESLRTAETRRTARRRVVSRRIRIGTSAGGGALGLALAESEIFAPAAPRRAPRRRRRAPRDVHLLGGRYPLSAIQIALGFELGRARVGGARGGVSSRPRVPGDATRVAPGSGRRAALEPTHASVLDERPRDARRVLRARRATRLGGGGGRYGRSESIPRAG